MDASLGLVLQTINKISLYKNRGQSVNKQCPKSWNWEKMRFSKIKQHLKHIYATKYIRKRVV